jgi:hypothetical protein
MLRRGWAQSCFRVQKQIFRHSSGLDEGLGEFARTERRQSPGCRQVTENTVSRVFRDAPLLIASSGLRPYEAIPRQTGEQKRQSDQ